MLTIATADIDDRARRQLQFQTAWKGVVPMAGLTMVLFGGMMALSDHLITAVINIENTGIAVYNYSFGILNILLLPPAAALAWLLLWCLRHARWLNQGVDVLLSRVLSSQNMGVVAALTSGALALDMIWDAVKPVSMEEFAYEFCQNIFESIFLLTADDVLLLVEAAVAWFLADDARKNGQEKWGTISGMVCLVIVVLNLMI